MHQLFQESSCFPCNYEQIKYFFQGNLIRINKVEKRERKGRKRDVLVVGKSSIDQHKCTLQIMNEWKFSWFSREEKRQNRTRQKQDTEFNKYSCSSVFLSSQENFKSKKRKLIFLPFWEPEQRNKSPSHGFSKWEKSNLADKTWENKAALLCLKADAIYFAVEHLGR